MVSCLGSLVQSCCGREEHCQKISLACVGSVRRVSATLGLPGLWCVCFPSLCCSGSRLPCREQALGCVHFPALSHSGSGSRVDHEGTDLVGPAFCALPRSKKLRQPGVWRAHSSWVASVSYHLPGPSRLVSWVAAVHPSPVCHVSLLGS